MDGLVIARRAKPLLVAISLIAAGCTPELASWSQARSIEAADIKPVVLSHAVQFGAGTGVMTAEEEHKLSIFLASAGPTSGDSVTLVAPAAPNGLTEQRRAAVERILKQQDVGAYTLAVNRAPGAGNVIVVRLERYVANPPACPELSEAAGDDFSDTPPTAFGCATATNIALMAAHPRDLLYGAPGGGADATYAARAVELYRAGAIFLHSPSGGPPTQGGAGVTAIGGAGGGSGGASGTGGN